MLNATVSGIEDKEMICWLPDEVQLYLKHTEEGVSIRALARDRGVHASTVLRQVRKTEARRDDPLVDALLTRLGDGFQGEDAPALKASKGQFAPEDDQLAPHIKRLLRALLKPGSIMAVSQGVDTAVVLSATEGADPVPTAKGPTEAVEVMALRGWIEGESKGRVVRYRISADGRVALNRLLAQAEGRAMGFAEAPAGFMGMPEGRSFEGATRAERSHSRRTSRPTGAETPVRVLGRAKGRSPAYLPENLVEAAERLQRDFALGQFEMATSANWDSIMKAEGAGAGPSARGGHPSDRKLDARKRVAEAMTALGPELGEIAIAVCCHERGMERIESDLNMPARSGKYLLRVALNYLLRHYSNTAGEDHDIIY